MMKINFKKLMIMVVICLMIVFLGALSTLAAAQPRLILRVSHSNTEDHCYHLGLVGWSEAIDKASNGEIKVEIYSNGVLGDDKDALVGVQMGAIDFCLTNNGFLPSLIPKLNILNLPYIFKDVAHLYRVCDGGLQAKINEYVEKQNVGFLTLSCISGGTRCFYTKKPIYKLKDLANLRIRVMENDLYINMVKLCGAKGTPMPYEEIYTSLQTGVIDGAENDLGSYYTQKHYEACPYYIFDDHNVDIEFLLASTKTWEKLSAADKKILIDALPAFVKADRKAMEQNEVNMKAALKKLGITLIEVDKEEFKKAVMPLWKSATDEYGSELFDIIMAIK